MVALHNQSETIEEGSGRAGSAFLDRADCIYAGMEARGETIKRDWGSKMWAGAGSAVMGGPHCKAKDIYPRGTD